MSEKKLLVMLTDEEAERFIDTIDLSGFRPMRFEFAPKNERVTMRLRRDLLAAVKAQAKRRGLPYQRYIRITLERAVQVDMDVRR